MKRFPASVALTMFLAVFATAMGQPCKVGVQAPPVGFWSWAPESRVTVYVVGQDFTESELPFLLAPLSTWNAVSDSTGSKVKFEYKGTTIGPRYCENCLTIKRAQVFDKSRRHLTELKAFSVAENSILTWATIVIDPLLTNRKALTNAVAHELGHSFGLLDCYSCKPDSTVMIKFKEVNVAHETVAPSVCDVAQVKRSYVTPANQPKRSRQLRPMAIDEEGEEPVEDDTPIVVPKP